MANGLRKIIKKARREYNKSAILASRRNRFGSRLGVEELEERIAPTVTLLSGEYVNWDLDAGDNDTFDATDGILIVGDASTVTSVLMPDITDGGGAAADTATTTLTVTGSGAATEILYIASNQSITSLDLSGITSAATTKLVLIVAVGDGATIGAANANDTYDNDDIAVDGIDINGAAGTAVGNAGAQTATVLAGNNYTENVAATIGTITLPDLDTLLDVEIHILSGQTGGSIGTITSANVNTDLTDDVTNTQDSLIMTPTLTTLSWGGAIDGGASGVTVDVATSIGSLTTGELSATAVGTISIDADTSIGGTTFGGIDIDGGGSVTVNAGSTGFSGALATGAIDVAAGAAGNLSISTTGTGGLSGVTTGAITNNSTAGAAITIAPAGTGATGSFTATGLISNAAAVVNDAIVIGSATGALGNVSLAGVTVNSTNNGGGISFLGSSMGTVTSSAAIETAVGAAGDLLFDAGAGAMGNLTAPGGITAGTAGATIMFLADDGMGNVDVTGSVGGAGAISFDADNDSDLSGDIGTIEVNNGTGTAAIGDGVGAVSFAAVDIGNITTDNIGTGAGAVSFTADGTDATDGAGGGRIGTLDVTNDVASGAGGVTFTADDGMGAVTIGSDAAQGGALTFNVNVDGEDDTGALGAITAQTLGDADGNDDGTVDAAGTAVTINTNGGATDNTTERGLGAITVTDGNARLDIVADGDVPLISVTGGDGSDGNKLYLNDLDLGNTDDPTNLPDLAGITVEDIAGENDQLMLANGVFEIPGTMGPIIVGGADAGDVMTLGTTDINVYSGDATGGTSAFTSAYASAVDSNIDLTAGDIVSGGGTIVANTRAASNLLTYVKSGVTFAVTTASDVTANIAFDPDGGNAGEESVAITELAGTSSSDDLSVSTADSSEFDVSAITPAVDGVLDVRNITIEGDLIGNIGTAALGFDAVQTIIIQGTDGGNQFFGTSLMGYASTDNLLVLTGVDILTLDTEADGTEDLVLVFGSTFNFADDAGADNAVDQFNHHISVAGTAGTATIRGIDGSGDSTADALYTFEGSGASTAQTGATNDIDPNDLITGAAMISRIMITGIDGLGTDVAVREIDGDTSGSWLEFNTNVGLVNLTTQLDSISVGIDDNSDLVDNAVSTSITGTLNTRNDIDRLGGGQNSGNKIGLNPATSVSDATAALGNFVVQSMGASTIASNINIVVTGNSGPITLTGDTDLVTPDHGNLMIDDGAQAAAIAIGGNLAGALTIPGQIVEGNTVGTADILIGIAVDGNNDGDWLDAGETPSGSVNAAITIGDAVDTDILVADNVDADIVVMGQEQDIEIAGLELAGALNGVKAIGALNNDIIVANSLEYVIADGINAADIFSGGNVADTVEIEGTTITGGAVLGAVNGVTSLTLIDHAVAGDVGDIDVITLAGGGGMVLQYVAGAIGATDTLGDIYVPAGIGSITVTTPNGDAMNIGDIFLLNDGSANFTTPGDMGVVVAADDATIPTSEALQDLITTTDVVMSPTALDTASGDSGLDLPYDGTIIAENAGGVIAEGDVTIDADIAGTIGDIVALDGFIVADVHAGVSIGHIVASLDIDGEFISEGTLAVGTDATLDANLVSFGLTGVPTWFNGGILSEAGDIGLNDDTNAGLDMDLNGLNEEATFTAAGDATDAGGTGSFGWASNTMGTFYVPAGEMSADINVGGNFGGIQVPAGEVRVELTVPMESTIERLIAPQFISNGGNSSTTAADSSFPDAEIMAISGETLVFDDGLGGGSSYTTGNTEVSVSGTGTLAIVDDNGTDDVIDDILVVDGIAAADTLSVTNGSVDLLTIRGDWAGSVSVTSDLDSTGATVEMIDAPGTIAATADLTAYNFGRIDGDTTAVETTGTLSGRDSVSFTNLAGDTQTVFLNANSHTTADYTMVFGKMTELELVGRGSASVVSVEGNYDASDRVDLRDLRAFERAGRTGVGLGSVDSAHLGGLMVMSTGMNLNSVVVGGDLDSLDAPKNVSSLWVAGDVDGTVDTNGARDGGVTVGGNINRAFIGGSVNDFAARIARNVVINDGASTVTAFTMAKSNVHGTTGTLNIGTVENNGVRLINRGSLINSTFEDVTTNNVVRAIRSSIG